MAFNFNWSPLMADAGFYTRAQDLLTAALNKSPKPPIIVGDIVVTELNLGSVPPELEILEVGDLAEDRFRGIFKMSYSGDAFLTLKTCVQANSMNTYLVTRPSFTSPTPLAAAHGLTIPLQITLSEIKLSGFVILVYSKQKGITLVFRNDPLESLKVSSTFDSIPFVRDYLQKEIEGQLRILFMDELPAIIHRLSLRLWVPEYRGQEASEAQADESSAAGPGQDPLLNPPQDPVDASGNVLSLSQIASLSLDSGVEMHSLFSQKNLLRLATLRDSQRTLSLFTPSIQEVVFRASTGLGELGENQGFASPTSPPLTRTHSLASSLHSLQDSTTSSRPSLVSPSFSGYGLSMGAGRHTRTRPSKKQKRRIVDLRRPKKSDEMSDTSQESTYSDSVCPPTLISQPTIPEEQDDDPVTPPLSRANTVREAARRRPSILNDKPHYKPPQIAESSKHIGGSSHKTTAAPVEATSSSQQKAPVFETYEPSPAKHDEGIASVHGVPPSMLSFVSATQERSILEQAWIMKLANEVTRRIQDGKSPLNMNDSGRRSRDTSPPPAYGQ